VPALALTPDPAQLVYFHPRYAPELRLKMDKQPAFWPAAIRELTERINRARYIGVRHGTAVAFVASGFAKHTGRLGVCSARRNRARFT
jgi:hypothetical protein